MNASLSITFVGGARSVTGSHFLIEAKKGDQMTRVAIDCGLKQGGRFCESSNNRAFPYDVSTLSAVFFTHAHADHIGLFPKLVKEGFTGKAYATTPTKELMPIMLEDSVSIIAREARECGDEPPYTKDDVEKAVARVTPLEYHETISVGNDMRVTYYQAGHILGSALVMVEIYGTRLLFTGDLGRVPALIVPDRDIPEGPIDYLITESVYGNRVHEDEEKSEHDLLHAIQRVQKNKGTLLIPSFSLERTQIILSILDRFISEKHIESIPVFLDSPLAIKVTEVYKNNVQYLRNDIQGELKKGNDPFSFPSLRMLYSREDSQEVDETPAPKIIIAGAGMSHGGRVRNHEKTYLPESKNELLLVGYQVPGSLGRRLQDGASTVVIDKKKVKVRARVSKTGGFSAHADRDGLLSFAEAVKPKQVFVVLGEVEQSSFLAQRIDGFLGITSMIPQEGERIEIPLQ